MNEQEHRVRPATPDDARKIADINVRAWRGAYGGIISEAYLAALDADVIAERVRETVRRHSTIVVAEGADGVVGYSWTTTSRDEDAAPATAEVIALYVDPDVQRRGVGRLLLQHSVGVAVQQAARRVTLWVLEANAGARRFYAALGFAPDGARKVTARWGGVPVAEVRYARSVSPSLGG